MSTDVPEYEIRLMKREEIPQVIDLWRETNLTEGTHSVDTWFEYDPEAFYVAVTNDGTVLGVCAGIFQHNDLAFVGMYVVTSTYRGLGIGRQLWEHVMTRVGDRNAGVNPVPRMLENYRDKGGFPVQADWCSVVCTTSQVPTPEMAAELPGTSVTRLSQDNADLVEAVSAYEAQVLGFSRCRLIAILAAEQDSVTLVATSDEDGTVRGFGTARQDIKGKAHVGPLYADDSRVAELVLHHLVKSLPVAESEGVTMMLVDCNRDALEMVERLGFEKKAGTARLYREEEVEVQFRKVFAQHNLNFSVF